MTLAFDAEVIIVCMLIVFRRAVELERAGAGVALSTRDATALLAKIIQKSIYRCSIEREKGAFEVRAREIDMVTEVLQSREQ